MRDKQREHSGSKTIDCGKIKARDMPGGRTHPIGFDRTRLRLEHVRSSSSPPIQCKLTDILALLFDHHERTSDPIAHVDARREFSRFVLPLKPSNNIEDEAAATALLSSDAFMYPKTNKAQVAILGGRGGSSSSFFYALISSARQNSLAWPSCSPR